MNTLAIVANWINIGMVLLNFGNFFREHRNLHIYKYTDNVASHLITVVLLGPLNLLLFCFIEWQQYKYKNRRVFTKKLYYLGFKHHNFIMDTNVNAIIKERQLNTLYIEYIKNNEPTIVWAHIKDVTLLDKQASQVLFGDNNGV